MVMLLGVGKKKEICGKAKPRQKEKEKPSIMRQEKTA